MKKWLVAVATAAALLAGGGQQGLPLAEAAGAELGRSTAAGPLEQVLESLAREAVYLRALQLQLEKIDGDTVTNLKPLLSQAAEIKKGNLAPFSSACNDYLRAAPVLERRYAGADGRRPRVRRNRQNVANLRAALARENARLNRLSMELMMSGMGNAFEGFAAMQRSMEINRRCHQMSRVLGSMRLQLQIEGNEQIEGNAAEAPSLGRLSEAAGEHHGNRPPEPKLRRSPSPGRMQPLPRRTKEPEGELV